MVARGWMHDQTLKAKKPGEYQVLPEPMRGGAQPEKKPTP
jgi:hypothetical protein